ncbi:MAG: universal stress protein [Leifsonia sp.]
MTPQTIVVGIDGSIPSRAAIRWGAVEALATGADLLLAHVIDDEWGVVSSRMAREIGDTAPELVDAERLVALTIGPALSVTTRILSGSPMWELARLSSARTLIVVGTHKSGFHYGRAYGSRSLQLATSANGSIAVVPDSAVRSRRGVVVGVDPSPPGLAAIDVAADEAALRGCDLTVVRAWHPNSAVPSDAAEQTTRELLASAVRRARRRNPHTTIRSRAVCRPAGAALNEIARGAELLVIGDSRRAGSQPGTLGSVAYDVLLNLTSPTIVVHTTVSASDELGAIIDDDAMTEGLNHARH